MGSVIGLYLWEIPKSDWRVLCDVMEGERLRGRWGLGDRRLWDLQTLFFSLFFAQELSSPVFLVPLSRQRPSHLARRLSFLESRSLSMFSAVSCCFCLA